jgi:hypothetical protein
MTSFRMCHASRDLALAARGNRGGSSMSLEIRIAFT